MARGRNIKQDVESLTMVIRRIIRENGRDYVKTYIFAAFCLVLVAASTAFMAWIMEAVINEAFAKKNADLIWVICGSVLAAFVIRGAASYGQAVALAQVGNNLVARYQQRLIDHLMSLGVSYFGDTRSAQIAAQISQNVAGIRDVMNLTITSFARDLLTLVALIIVMITKDPVLSLIVLVVSPPVLHGAALHLEAPAAAPPAESIDLNSRVLSAMQETVQGITIVKAFTMEEQISGRTAGLIKSAEERSNRIARLTERTSPLTETVAGIAISGVIAYAAFRSIYGDVLPGAFFSFITALLLAYDPARRLARLQINLERAVVNARMIYEILDEQPTQGDNANATELAVDGGEIEFRNVGFGYGLGEPVLEDVSFTAEAGKTTAIVGPSGAGKSTLISLVPRFYDPSSGQVLIDGADIARRRPRGHCASRSPTCPSRPGCSKAPFVTICAMQGPMPPMPRSRTRQSWPMPMTSFSASPRDTTRRWVKTAPTCPVVSASASRLPGRWCATRRSCCSTKPPLRSTMNPRPRSRRRSKARCSTARFW